MSILPFEINSVIQLYNKVSDLKPPATKKMEKKDTVDVIVNISPEAKKRQVSDQAKNEGLKGIV